MRLVEVNEGGKKGPSSSALTDGQTVSVTVGVKDTVVIGGGVEQELWSFAGTYDGVPGTFKCAGMCTAIGVTYTPAGDDEDDEEMVALALDSNAEADDDWYFQPTNADSTVKVGDRDYLYFGTWTEEPEGEDAAHSFTTFFGAGFGDGEDNAFTVSTSNLIGTGSYDGPAAGRYSTENAIQGSVTSGEFVASAHLKANFDDMMIGEDGLAAESIWGEITDFMENGESLGAWRVDLGATEIGNGTFNGNTGLDIGKLELDNSTTVGVWNGRFYGDEGPQEGLMADGDDDASTDEEIAAAQPSGVAGEFSAQYESTAASAIIVGAFGATRTR